MIWWLYHLHRAISLPSSAFCENPKESVRKTLAMQGLVQKVGEAQTC